jgi:hypothetical protein
MNAETLARSSANLRRALERLADRNRTSHLYDAAVAGALCQRIRAYALAVRTAFNALPHPA